MAAARAGEGPMSGCCAPGREPGGERHAAHGSVVPVGGAPPDAGQSAAALVAVPGGVFRMGASGIVAYDADGEGPIHAVELDAYRIGATCVTNDEFAAFIEATGHRTEAERFGWSFVFGGLLPDDFPPTRGVAAAPWWRQVYGADWRHPEGSQSDLTEREDHPVVHVSWQDAVAYCEWSGTRLPTEAEWECAARGGREGAVFPWGDELEPGGRHMMNVFQGTFPGDDTGDDGWIGTAPVDAFQPNGFGVHNMTGNVWEWCGDWYSPRYYGRSRRRDPQGPDRGQNRVMRGGSYLCHASYCRRYRVAARSGNSPDSSAGNVGFRVAA